MTRQRGERRTLPKWVPKHQRAARVNWPNPNSRLSGNRVVGGKYNFTHVSSAGTDSTSCGQCGHGQQLPARGRQDGTAAAATRPSRSRRPPSPRPPRGRGRRQRPAAWRPRRRRQPPACTLSLAAAATAAAAAVRPPPRQWRRCPARGGGFAAAGLARGVAPDGGSPSRWSCTGARPARRSGRGGGGCGAPDPPNGAPVWRSCPFPFVSGRRGAPAAPPAIIPQRSSRQWLPCALPLSCESSPRGRRVPATGGVAGLPVPPSLWVPGEGRTVARLVRGAHERAVPLTGGAGPFQVTGGTACTGGNRHPWGGWAFPGNGNGEKPSSLATPTHTTTCGCQGGAAGKGSQSVTPRPRPPVRCVRPPPTGTRPSPPHSRPTRVSGGSPPPPPSPPTPCTPSPPRH